MMTLDDVLQRVTTVFLDTAPVIYYVEQNPHYIDLVDAVYNRIDRGELRALTSPVTLAECLVSPLRLASLI
jgi:hypothetical protein